jgi:copper transport protein
MRRRPFSALVLLLLAAAVGAASLPCAAAAHSALESTDPAADSSLETAPKRIVLTFTEPSDAGLSLIRVFDAAGRAVPDVTKAQSVKGDEYSLEVRLGKQLGDGVYTVNWRAVSSVDGHVETGAFAFGVGEKPRPGSAVVVELLHTSPWASALGVASRWLLYTGLAVLIGAATTSLLVYSGRLPGGGIKVLQAAMVVTFVGLAAMVWSEKVLVGAPSLLPLFITRQGQLLLALAVALGLSIGAVVLVDLWPARWSLWLLGAAAAAAAFVHVLSGHAANPASLEVFNVTVQWVHLTAIGVWVGGLLWLLLGLRGRDATERGAAVGVFTRLATVVLVMVLVTGLVRALAEVGSATGLFGTRYGVTLLVKIALVTGLVGLGALNHFLWVPPVRVSAGGRADRRFGLNSRGELVVALGVLAATAVLSGLLPARTAITVAGADSTPITTASASGSDYATSLRATLTLTPGVAGFNDYDCRIEDYDSGEPLATVTGVRLRCTLPARPALADVTIALRKSVDDGWKGKGLDFSAAGRWKVEVSVQEESRGTIVPLEIVIRSAETP